MTIPIAWARIARALTALGALLLASGIGLAQAQSKTFDVTGIVTATDGTLVAGAAVVLISGDRSQTARTDAHGTFHLSSIAGGTYTLTANAPGYQQISARTVTLNPENSFISVVLAAATTSSLTVIGRVSTSSGETVSTSSAPTVSINTQTAAAAGVTSVAPLVWNQLSTTPFLPMGGGSNASATFAVRGPDPTETLVDIDGHPVNNGNTGDFDLSLLDPAALQDVQLVYGISPSSLIGPNTIGGGINIITLQPTATPHSLLRIFGGSYGAFGETLQSTGTDGRLGYAVSLHGRTANGSVNQTILAPSVNPPSEDLTEQSVGSGSYGSSILTKLRYQLGGSNGYGYLQLNFRNQTVSRDESALLTSYTPPGFTGGDEDDARIRAVSPLDDVPSSPYQSFAGTTLGAHNANYGFDAQLPLGNQSINDAPANVLLFSHQTTLAAQSVSGPGAQTMSYLYNQRDAWNDDWLEFDHHFKNSTLSFKYDINNETLTSNYVQGQIIAEAQPVSDAVFGPNDDAGPPVQTFALAQTQRSAVLRWVGDASSHIHYALATYFSDDSTFGQSFDPRAGLVWTPTANTAVRGSVGTTFQTPQLSELIVPPPADRVPIGGVIFIGNPDLKPDYATDFDLGGEQIVGGPAHPLRLSADLYQTNLRSPANQLNVEPNPNCQTRKNPTPCPLSIPVNAGNGVYRGLDIRADQQLGAYTHLRAGWDVDSSYLTVIPASIQDGTLVPNEQSLGQPLHKAFLAFDQDPPQGLAYGASLNYEGSYNELNRSPYALLGAHVAYRRAGFEYGIYGTNLTNVYSQPFTIVGGGVPYGTLPGNPMINPPAYILQGAAATFVVTRVI
jgi:outer membrane receptor protein involved in Fe transport